MKKIMWIAAAATLMTAACTKDVVKEVNPQKEISFKGLIDNSLTKGAVATAETKVLADYRVTATYSNESEKFMDNLTVDRATGKNEGLPYYWPGDRKLDFFAVTPSRYDFALSNGSGTKSITVSRFEVDENYAKQEDLMFAITPNINHNATGEQVSLLFRHALAQITFRATLSHNLEVTVESITIHNVRNSATLKWDGTSFADPQYDTSREDFKMELGAAKTVPSTGSVDLSTGPNEGFLMIPQTLAAWSEDTDTGSARNNGQSYLEIRCRIRNGEYDYIVGGADSFGSTYVSFPTEWKAGYHYIYTLRFGAGRDDQGKVRRQPISFTTEVENWSGPDEGFADGVQLQ